MQTILILLTRFYQLIISPLSPNVCRFSPTCSRYAIESINAWGVRRGIWLTLKRLSKCHPWGPCGHDPVPTRYNVEQR